MQSKNFIKRILTVSVGIVSILVVFVIVWLQYPRFMTQVFFGVNTAPVELNLKNEYSPRESDEKTRGIVRASMAFLASLDDSQRQVAVFAFSNNAQRSNWSNFPEGMIPRDGLKLGELSQKQRTLLDNLLSEIMSEKGVQNINYQLAAEDTIPPSSILKYGSQDFYVAFLGQPSDTYPWMFQFGGHHLAINVTVYGSDVTFSPMLTGSEPVQINYKGKDIYITQEEASAAQALLDNLTEDQKKIAVRGEEAIDLLLGPGEYGTVVVNEGIKGSDLTDEQKLLLVEVIKMRLGFINDNDYAATMATVLTELDDTYFGWWGPQDRVGFAYFRVTGPSLVLEYAPQDDDDASLVTHVHSMYRNPKNDYGAAWLRGD